MSTSYGWSTWYSLADSTSHTLSHGQLCDAASITHVARFVLTPTMHCNTMSTTAAAHLS